MLHPTQIWPSPTIRTTCRSKEFDGCIVENYTAKTYEVSQYLVDITYVAPDIVKKRMKRFA